MTTTYVQFKDRIYQCSECKKTHSMRDDEEFYPHRVFSISGPGQLIYEDVTPETSNELSREG